MDSINNLWAWKSVFTYRDGRLYWKYDRSQKTKAGDPAGSVSNDGRMSVSLNGKSYRVHRVIYEMHFGAIPKGMIIEHINGNQEDNRLENLRLVNRIRAGRRLQKNNTSGVSGVHFARLINKWEAWFGGECLGRFDDFTSAVETRRKREKSFIDQGERGAGGNSHA